MKRYGWLFPSFVVLSLPLLFAAGCLGIKHGPVPERPKIWTPPADETVVKAMPPMIRETGVSASLALAAAAAITNYPPRGIHLQWVTLDDPKRVAGYKIYMGFTSARWEQIIPVNNTNQALPAPTTNIVNITNLRSHPYVFAVSAIGTNGAESPLSEIATWNLPNTNGTPSISNGAVHLYLLVNTNAVLKIEKSSNLTNWTLVTNASNLDGVVSFYIGTNTPKGYQRVTRK